MSACLSIRQIEIEACFPDRSDNALRKQYARLCGTPERRRVPRPLWTVEEDQLLVKLKAIDQSAYDIQKAFPTRTSTAIEARYYKVSGASTNRT